MFEDAKNESMHLNFAWKIAIHERERARWRTKKSIPLKCDKWSAVRIRWPIFAMFTMWIALMKNECFQAIRFAKLMRWWHSIWATRPNDLILGIFRGTLATMKGSKRLAITLTRKHTETHLIEILQKILCLWCGMRMREGQNNNSAFSLVFVSIAVYGHWAHRTHFTCYVCFIPPPHPLWY